MRISDIFLKWKKVLRVYRVKISGPAVQWPDKRTIRRALVLFADEMLIQKLEIQITEDKNHFGQTWDGGQVVGHFHEDPLSNKICFLPEGICLCSIAHEIAHAYHYFLDSTGELFTQEWRAIAGDVYNKDPKTPDGQGVVRSYCRLNHKEDIAEWFAYCQIYLYEADNRFSEISDHRADIRYRQKLDLLHEYKFLSDEQYAKLKPLFQ